MAKIAFLEFDCAANVFLIFAFQLGVVDNVLLQAIVFQGALIFLSAVAGLGPVVFSGVAEDFHVV